jgi:hypothetical protein
MVNLIIITRQYLISIFMDTQIVNQSHLSYQLLVLNAQGISASI